MWTKKMKRRKNFWFINCHKRNQKFFFIFQVNDCDDSRKKIVFYQHYFREFLVFMVIDQVCCWIKLSFVQLLINKKIIRNETSQIVNSKTKRKSPKDTNKHESEHEFIVNFEIFQISVDDNDVDEFFLCWTTEIIGEERRRTISKNIRKQRKKIFLTQLFLSLLFCCFIRHKFNFMSWFLKASITIKREKWRDLLWLK